MAAEVEKNDFVVEVDGVEIPENEKTRDVDTRSVQDVDFLIVGAGISGINMSYRFQQHFPSKSYLVLEQRETMGGTWDLMRYPGIRSDSDLHTFGFAWRPWEEKEPIAEGYKILKYMNESAALYGIDKKILYRHRVLEANWSSREQAWTLVVEATEEDGSATKKHFRAPFLVMGTGYYDYKTPLQAKIPGIETFKGRVVHPQFWTKDIEYADRKVAVIGSGATAITLIPALAQTATKVSMVQRSPTYVLGFPNRTNKRRWWEWFLPNSWFHWFTRLRYLIGGIYIRRFLSDPVKARAFIEKMNKRQLPSSIPWDPHFKPRYDPWTQRMCFCPDNDFFKALQKGNTDVVTGNIKTVTEDRLIMDDGHEVEADIIVTATGLRMQYGGNTRITVDGEELVFGNKFFWRGVMISDVPNMAIVMGYTKASWTLGADATAAMVMRMLKYMSKRSITSATPRVADAEEKLKIATTTPALMGLSSTYILTALHRLPKTLKEDPWRARENYLWDMWDSRFADLSRAMQFTYAPR
jgi:cation diffusion facilitator CzcD-associated flavoprotein CzcO